ncbi:hypothetical protein DEO72_LG7g1747 [Vigna unguiculata]|uniref:Uncharacterized protein n=1 Tax=Vigna unguiculata TaxID=3917 RepID=A0A4D6MKC5_VIGUN|nr:hypothetical protein DEO72_LG7g1747 [Vigna unguiculata]
MRCGEGSRRCRFVVVVFWFAEVWQFPWLMREEEELAVVIQWLVAAVMELQIWCGSCSRLRSDATACGRRWRCEQVQGREVALLETVVRRRLCGRLRWFC